MFPVLLQKFIIYFYAENPTLSSIDVSYLDLTRKNAEKSGKQPDRWRNALF